jgi:hypothetical protein
VQLEIFHGIFPDISNIQTVHVTKYNCMLLFWLGIHGIYINASITDEGALLKLGPYKIEVQFPSTSFHYKNLGSLMLFPESNHPNVVICILYIIHGIFTNAMDGLI